MNPPSKEGIFQDLGLRIRLVLRLMADRRVSPFLKVLPVASILYLFFPELIFGPILATPIDDAFVIWLATHFFVELCPDDIVAGHVRHLKRSMAADLNETTPPADVIDAEFIDEEKSKDRLSRP